jgi:hypothetical protein
LLQKVGHDVEFLTFQKIPQTNPPQDYFSFFKYSRNLNVPNVDLYSYQHIAKQLFVKSDTIDGTLAPASKVKNITKEDLFAIQKFLNGK